MFENWFRRHRNRRSLVLHAIGIPLTIAAIPLAVAAGATGAAAYWLAAGGGLVIGYALQFIGHAIEGNDAGELILVKKLLGRPYVAEVEPPIKEAQDG